MDRLFCFQMAATQKKGAVIEAPQSLTGHVTASVSAVTQTKPGIATVVIIVT